MPSAGGESEEEEEGEESHAAAGEELGLRRRSRQNSVMVRH